MMDVLNKEQRRKNMQAIRSTNTKMEVALAKALWASGHRYRKNDKTVFGKPDLTFKQLKIAVFVDSEYFHGKDWVILKHRINTNRKFWWNKIETNMKRDFEDRMNFGGVHKTGVRHQLTNLEMQLIGFDTVSGKIRSTNGRIALVDKNDNEAASWSFSSMLLHWNRKHNQACYVPSLTEKEKARQYKYGNKIILGTGTDFQLFLGQMAKGNIYYDPGIKMENVSTKPKIKKRSQFRIKSQHLPNLYKQNEIVDITT